jgi:hypothetical protein
MLNKAFHKYRVRLFAEAPDRRFINLQHSLALRKMQDGKSELDIGPWYYFYEHAHTDPILIRPNEDYRWVLHPGVSRWIGSAMRPKKQHHWITANWIATDSTPIPEDGRTIVESKIDTIKLAPEQWSSIKKNEWRVNHSSNNSIIEWAHRECTNHTNDFSQSVANFVKSVIGDTHHIIEDQAMGVCYNLNPGHNKHKNIIQLADHDGDLYAAVRELFHTINPNPKPHSE